MGKLTTAIVAVLAVLSAGALLCDTAAAKDPIRVWVDSTGQHAIEATLIEVNDGSVVLLRTDGQRTTIAIDKLSEQDKQYIEESGTTTVNTLRTAAPPAPDVQPLPTLDLPNAETVAESGSVIELQTAPLVAVPTKLPLELDPDRAPIEVPIAEQQFQLQKIDTYDDCSSIFSVGSVDAPALGMSVSEGFSLPGEDSIHNLVRFDAQTGETSVVWKSPNRVRLLDHLPAAGQSLVLVGHNPLGQGGQLALASGWDAASITITHEHEFPSGTQIGQAPHVRWAKLIDDQHFVAAVDQTLIAANIVSGKVLYRLDGLGNSAVPAISGGRRYLAIPVAGAVHLYRTEDGVPLGRIGTESSLVPTVRFSNLGESLAIVTPRRMRVWSLPDAALRADIVSRRSLGIGQPVWVDSDLVMTSSGVLLSIFRGVSIWRYEVTGAVADYVGGNVAIVRKHPHSILSVLKLPHEGAARALAWIDAVPKTTEPEKWRVPGRSVWAKEGWNDKDVRLSSQSTSLR